MNTREYWLSKKYFDLKKFPYGFSRSGDYTIEQSQKIESHGMLITALLDGQVSNPTEDDLMLVQQIRSGNAENNELAKLWLKYLGINRMKISVSSSATKESAIELDEESWSDDESWEEVSA
jgi:uncharacterized protein